MAMKENIKSGAKNHSLNSSAQISFASWKEFQNRDTNIFFFYPDDQQECTREPSCLFMFSLFLCSVLLGAEEYFYEDENN